MVLLGLPFTAQPNIWKDLVINSSSLGEKSILGSQVTESDFLNFTKLDRK